MSESLPIPTSTTGAAPAASWHTLALPGLALDTIGHYLASIGILALASREWPGIRGCWRSEQFLLINGPPDIDSLAVFLLGVAKESKWSNYEKAWADKQKEDTKNKNSVFTGLWRSQEATESELCLFDSHIAGGERLSFNPVFGSGGNAGQRDFANGRKKAATVLRKTNAKDHGQIIADLTSFLIGRPCSFLGDFGAASWFSSANKAYNSGTKKAFRKGQVTPWAMALACEAFFLLRGGTSRHLGSDRRGTGAFPFVTAAAAPENAGEATRNVGELWLPVWERPMSLPELATLFSRGLARARGRAAVTSPAFCAAILQRGVDAGIGEFRRFTLFHTTSENTFESRLASVIPVPGFYADGLADAVEVALALREALPPDKKIYSGLQGPVDRALIELAAHPEAETARALVDAMIDALRRVDRNRTHRMRALRFRLLPGVWARSLVGEREPVTAEIRLAFALASLIPTQQSSSVNPKQVTAPLLAYWLGAKNQGTWWEIAEGIPLRRVWGGGELVTNVAAVLRRRLVEESPTAAAPFAGRARVALADIELLLANALDESEVTRWLFRFSLFSEQCWNSDGHYRQSVIRPRTAPVTPALALYALFKPLFDDTIIQDESVGASRPVKVGTLSRIAALLSRGDINSAIQAARHAYHAVGVELADFQCQFELSNTAHLLAALSVPVSHDEITTIFRRWRAPAKLNQQKEART
jgi:CRISPR-associated protein Csx17